MIILRFIQYIQALASGPGCSKKGISYSSLYAICCACVQDVYMQMVKHIFEISFHNSFLWLAIQPFVPLLDRESVGLFDLLSQCKKQIHELSISSQEKAFTCFRIRLND